MHVQPFKYSSTETPIIVDSSDTVSGEGSNIALANTAEAPFNTLRHKGNAKQKTLSGKNLFSGNYSQFDNTGGTGTTYAYFKLPTDGDYYFSLKAKSAITPSSGHYIGFSYNGGNAETSYRWIYQNNTTTAGQVFQGSNSQTTAGTTYKLQYVFMYPKTSECLQWFMENFELVQLEAGTSATDYEEFCGGIPSPSPDYPQDINVLTGNSTVKIRGKNIFDINTLAKGNITVSDGVATGTASVFTSNFGASTFGIIIPPTGSAILSVRATAYTDGNATTAGVGLVIRAVYTDGYTGNLCVWNNNDTTAAEKTGTTLDSRTLEKIIISYNSNGSNIWHLSNMQVEISNSPSQYELYKEQSYVLPFGDTYLAKIGDYADEPVKVDGTWYIRRAIGKVVLDGSESWWISGETLYTASITDYATANNTPISKYFTGALNVTGAADVPQNNMAFNNSTQYNYRFYIRYPSKFATVSDLTTWLTSNPTTIYYVLAAPTDEAITDQDLIDALDEFYDQAHAYKGQTNITASAADGNAPAVLSVDVNEDNESTVTNAGNTTSRPILTIYGQGNIGVYINDVEVLQVALGDEGYITLDSVEMEAYKDTTANLKNRLVTGDYSKLALNAGANKIRFTGIVTKYEISKYSRWL